MDLNEPLNLTVSKIIIALSVALTSLYTHADDLLDVYQQARESDPVYLAGFHQHEASKEIYDQARALLLPNIKFVISRTETSQEIVSSDNAVFGQGSTSYPTDEMSLSITQSIYSFSNWAYFKQAKEEVKQIAAEVEDVRQELVIRVAEAYFSVLKQRDNYLAVNAEFSALKKHYELVTTQEENGLARATDLLDANARLLQAQARQVEIGNDLRDSLQGLQEITGRLPSSLVILADHIKLVKPEPSVVQEWVDKAQATNPMILAKKSALAAAWQEVRREKGGHYPDFDLLFTQSNRDTQGSLFGGGSEVDTQEIQLKMTIPLFSGGAVSSKVRETVNLHLKSRDELAQRVRQTARETRAAFSGVTGSISEVNALQKSVEAYEAAVEAKRAAFENGLTVSVSVLDAERDLFIARSGFYSARYDYLLNTLRLKRATGILSEADLEQINRDIKGKEVSTNIDALLAEANSEASVNVKSIIFQNHTVTHSQL